MLSIELSAPLSKENIIIFTNAIRSIVRDTECEVVISNEDLFNSVYEDLYLEIDPDPSIHRYNKTSMEKIVNGLVFERPIALILKSSTSAVNILYVKMTIFKNDNTNDNTNDAYSMLEYMLRSIDFSTDINININIKTT